MAGRLQRILKAEDESAARLVTAPGPSAANSALDLRVLSCQPELHLLHVLCVPATQRAALPAAAAAPAHVVVVMTKKAAEAMEVR